MTEQLDKAISRAGNSVFGGEYPEAVLALIDLADMLLTEDTDEFIWESDAGPVYLADLIIGSYWHFTEWHAGQYSVTYQALCRLGELFSPGLSQGPEEGTGEEEVYLALEELAKKGVAQ